METSERVRHGSLMRSMQAYACTAEAQSHPFTLMMLQHLADNYVSGNLAVSRVIDALETHRAKARP